MPAEGTSVVLAEQQGLNEKSARTRRRGSRGLLRSEGRDSLTESVRACKLARCRSIERGHRPPPGLPCREPRQAEIDSASGLSEDCGNWHEKISTADGIDWIVRGNGASRGQSGPGASARASTKTNVPTGAGACATDTRKDRSAKHRKCGWQRGDVHDDVRAAGGGLRVKCQL